MQGPQNNVINLTFWPILEFKLIEIDQTNIVSKNIHRIGKKNKIDLVDFKVIYLIIFLAKNQQFS